MIDLEATLASRFPGWFRGARAPFARALVRGVSRIARLDEAERVLAAVGHLRGLAFVEAVLDRLDVRYTLDPFERERIRERGRLVVVANHPMGALDALVLLHAIGSVRPDVKIVANDFLAQLPGLAPLLLPVRILGGMPSADSLRAIERALEAEQVVIVFPAGEVARASLRGIRDGRWRRGFLRFARRTQAPILPVHLKGRNSAVFYTAAALAAPLGTAMLPREVFARRGARLALRIARERDPAELLRAGDERAAIAQVRRALEAIGRGREIEGGVAVPVAHATNPALVAAAIDALPCIGRFGEGKRIHAGRVPADSPLMAEIGRLRELSFRAVGEGTGRRRDLDAYDAHYDQIVLWDEREREIIGAYRVAPCAQILAERGEAGLYTASLFEFDAGLRAALPQALELGRSFVQPRYWGSRSLDQLWTGIGAYLRTRPDIRWLFGPVSISAALPDAARAWLVAYFQRYHGDRGHAAAPRRPYRFDGTPPEFGGLDRDAAMSVLRENLGALGAQVPVLYRHYIDLCEPGGASFLAFGVDPDFAGCVDGLVLVDLERLRPRKRARYLGSAEGDAPPTARPVQESPA